MHILVIGGGIGGLCLAQGLKKHGIRATVYERARVHSQGWRLTIKEEGDRALRHCLPASLYAQIRADALRPATRMVFMDEQLNPRFSKPIPPVAGHFGVKRLTLRETLLTGLDVRFGVPYERFSLDGAQVVAHLADGTSAAGDLLVGADGTNSAVRAQLLPHAAFDELGETLYGVTPFDSLDWVPDSLVDTFNRITDPRGVAMMVATCRPGDFFTWTLTGAADLATGWHPALRRIVAEAQTVFPVRLRSAQPVSAWNQERVTLLGDAIHTMSPGRGEGANTALRDARLLTIALTDPAVPLTAAKRLYEEEMLRYGFAMVSASHHTAFAPPVDQ